MLYKYNYTDFNCKFKATLVVEVVEVESRVQWDEMRVRTLTNSSNEMPTCVTALKRRSRKLSQQMLALLSANKDEHQQHLKGGQTESQSWSSPMASRGTLTTMGTTNGLNQLALDRDISGDILEYYAESDGQRDPRSTGYPPKLHSGHRSR